MADFAIHSSQATKTFGRPSIFDIVAQESLMSSLRPAFEFTIRTLSERFPEKLSGLLGYTDEIFYSFLALTERHFIWTKNSSFSEYFYGLRRITLSSLINGSKKELSFKQKAASWISLTLLPYLLSKLEKRFSSMREEIILSDTSPRRNFGRLSCIFYNLYPFIHCVLQGSKLMTMICYILRLINFNSISNSIIGLTLAYSNFDDNLNESTKILTNEKHSTVVLTYLSRFIGVCSYAFSISIEYALPTIMFILRFLEWWYSNSNSPYKHTTSLPIPPPPIDSNLPSSGFKLPPHPSQCPLCHNVHKNPTALSITGYVFCYACIFKFVKDHGYCPVTQIQCTIDNLVRLYV